MSQNLRLALWVPQADPAINNVVTVAGLVSPNKRVPTNFATPAGGGSGGTTVDFADNAEVTAGLIANEAISPSTLRSEMVREFAIPAGNFSNVIAIASSPGVAGANFLVKTDANGVLDATLVILDGGTF